MILPYGGTVTIFRKMLLFQMRRKHSKFGIVGYVKILAEYLLQIAIHRASTIGAVEHVGENLLLAGQRSLTCFFNFY